MPSHRHILRAATALATCLGATGALAAPPSGGPGGLGGLLNQVAAPVAAAVNQVTAPVAAAVGQAAAASPLGSPVPVSAPLQVLGTAPVSQPVEFDVVLPLTNANQLDTLLSQLNDPTSPKYHNWLTPAAFAQKYGPSNQMLRTTSAFLTAAGFTVTQQTRSLHVQGTAAQVNALFNTTLQVATDPVGRKRLLAPSNKLSVPGALASLNIVVPAFQFGRSDATPFIRRSTGGYANRSVRGYGTNGTNFSAYLFNDLKQAYSYPSVQTANGTGATVAVIMSSDVQDSDVAALFTADNFSANSGLPNPSIFMRRPVNGGPSALDQTSGEEAALDVEQVLGGAPGAHVMLYGTPDLSDQSLVSALVAVDNDNVADVVSMSYGQCELYYTAAFNNGVDQTPLIKLYSELYKQGNAQGITFVASSGDSGGLGCMSSSYFAGSGGSFVAGVSVPAADPSVTAVGGTNLVVARSAGGSDSSYLRENTFADMLPAIDPYNMGTLISGGVFGAGGGVSTLFSKPSYQNLVSTGSASFRSIPDVGMQVGGCPDDGSGTCDSVGTLPGDTGERSAVSIVYNGAPDNIIGTSAAAPEFASVVALMVQNGGRQGNVNPTLYSLAQRQAGGGSTYFQQNLVGNNGVAATGGAYSYAAGVGTPVVSALLGLANAPVAGAPGTASNP